MREWSHVGELWFRQHDVRSGRPDPLALLHEQDRLWIAARITLGDRALRVLGLDSGSSGSALVHHSALKRTAGNPDYRPPAIGNRKHWILQPDGSITPFQGLDGLVADSGS